MEKAYVKTRLEKVMAAGLLTNKIKPGLYEAYHHKSPHYKAEGCTKEQAFDNYMTMLETELEARPLCEIDDIVDHMLS